MTIQITSEIKNEIIEGIVEAQRVINYENGFSEDLRNNELVERYTNYIKEMSNALILGELKII
jgi:hypothetical protein